MNRQSMGSTRERFNSLIPCTAIVTASGKGPVQLARFLGALADRHGERDTVFSLRLGEAGLDALYGTAPNAPTVAVIGPTQTGKSTVVNIVAGGSFVETSPLAAHTQEAVLLAVNLESVGAGERIGGTVTAGHIESDAPSCLIWDTPDFDSNASDTYRDQVARVCAVADLVVVVLSKEKYADRSVWRVLETIAPLQVPTVLCLNKCDPGAPGGNDGRSDADILVPVIRRRIADSGLAPPDTAVAVLPRVATDDMEALLRRDDVRAFRRLVFDLLAVRPPSARRSGLARLVRENWADWTEPVEQELACHREWSALVAAQTQSFLERYRSEYIDHSRHHDVAQKAILGLLELLEVPALAGAMTRTRRVLTWPFRKLAHSIAGEPNGDKDQELAVVDAALEHCLLTLRREALARRGPWWRAASEALADHEPAVRRDFHAAIGRYRDAFQPRIDALSRELYEQLQRNPLTLNTLRAARVSADAGGIVLAFKTGTLGLGDALFAPAVISLTSYLTESAVGQYLRSVIHRLKGEQVEQVSAVIQDCLRRPLSELQPRGPGLFGVTRDELDRALEQVEALER